jgi:DNA-binding NarL/FixJ family response regulator
MSRIRILLADDHALVRAGFRALLSPQPDLEIIAEAADGRAAVEQCLRHVPDVVLLDICMPGYSGVQALREMRRACPAVKVLVVTMHEDEAYARQALEAGAAGYVLKRSLATELIAAIRKVYQGQAHISPSLSAARDEARNAETPLPDADLLGRLTETERKVVRLLALGRTNSDIATQLRLSDPTIEDARSGILAKLHLRTRAEVVRLALDHGLLNEDRALERP